MKIFLDTNVVLDYLTGREPFADDAEAVKWGADVIVTRDKDGFTPSSIPILTPSAFLMRYV